MADGAGNAQELKTLIENFNRTVETFKSDHTEALKSKANAADVITKEKHDKLVTDIEALKKSVNESIAELKRSGAGDAKAEAEAALAKLNETEHKAISSYIRTGDKKGLVDAKEEARQLEIKLDKKDLSTVVFADGGALVHPQIESQMIEVIEEISPMRAICGQMDAHESGEVEIPVDMGGWEAAWIDELSTRVKTATGDVAMRKFTAEELYAYPRLSKRVIEDVKSFDVEKWLYRKATKAMAIAEGRAVINGDGDRKPKGILRQTIVADTSWAWGKLGYLPSGKAGGFLDSVPGSAVGPTGAVNPADCLLDLVYAIPKPLRGNADWAMNRKTLGACRKLKDGDGQYIFRDAITANGIVTQILGYGVTEAEDMPDIAANSYAIAFGDFEEGYLIVDRTGLSVTRDEITQPGFVLVFFRRRVGGDVQDYQAIKLLKFAAS